MNTSTQQDQITATKKSILIVGGEPVLRDGLAAIIHHAPNFAVCGQAENATKAAAAVAALAPDAALVNILLDGSQGLETIEFLHASYPHLVIIAFVHDEPLLAAKATKLGATGVVEHNDLIGSLRRAFAHAPHVPQPPPAHRAPIRA